MKIRFLYTVLILLFWTGISSAATTVADSFEDYTTEEKVKIARFIITEGNSGDVLTLQPDGTISFETPAGGTGAMYESEYNTAGTIGVVDQAAVITSQGTLATMNAPPVDDGILYGMLNQAWTQITSAIDWTQPNQGTIDPTNYVDNDTVLSDEQVQDKAGAMWTGNTETRATVTYQNDDGTMDIVVDDMNDAPETLDSIKSLVTNDFHNLGGTDAVGPTYSFGTGLSEAARHVVCTVVDTNTTYAASDFDIKDLTDSTSLRSTWSGKEDEAHASEHAVSAADSIFPADPNADKALVWDDDPGALVWATPWTSAGYLTAESDPTVDTSGEIVAIIGAGVYQAPGAYLTSEVDGSTTNELQYLFETINCSSGTDPVADATTDTLNITGSGIVTITGDSATDTITISGTEVDGSITNEIDPAETAATIEDIMTGADAITTPADADTMSVVVSAVLKKVTWANIKTTLFSSPVIATPSISDSAYEPSGTGDKTPTLAELRRGTITNKNIGANTDIILDPADEYLTTRVLIVDTTYAYSLVPPSGECLRLNGTFLTANNEIDLSKVEGDKFVLTRMYSEAKTDFIWDLMETGQGTATDGGAGD